MNRREFLAAGGCAALAAALPALPALGGSEFGPNVTVECMPPMVSDAAAGCDPFCLMPGSPYSAFRNHFEQNHLDGFQPTADLFAGGFKQ